MADKATKTKAKPKAKAPKVKDAATKGFDAAFARWKKGEQICVLAAELKIRRGALRRQLRKRAGGKAEFKEMRATGAGGIRKSLGERPKNPDMDKGVKVIPVGGRKDWTHRSVYRVDGYTPVHVVGKTGVEYIAARKDEKADVLVELGNGLPHARLVYFHNPDAKK